LNELRDQTFLGRDSLANRKPVPDEWFGNSPEGIVMSKLIWESDIQHEWILHPYIFINDKLLSIDIASSKKKETTQQYHHFIHEIYTLGKQSFPAVENIMIDVYFRDSTDSLARFIWNNNLPYIDYKDEWMRKSRQEKLAKWET
jgi:hypothetical protein